jgi:PAS domain S-box-containing protein
MEIPDKELVKEAARYKAILESTSELIAVMTFALDPVYTYISRSHKRVFGYEREELLGKPGMEFIHPEDKVRYVPIILKYIGDKAKQLLTGRQSELVENVNFRFRDKQGKYHFMESTVNLMQDEMLFVSRDVTERRLAEECLKEKVKELEDFHKLAVGRELKMMELEKEIDQLKAKLANK